MKIKLFITISVSIYIFITSIFFVQNVLLAKEETSFKNIIEKENITSLSRRETLRAFYSSPPVIPHEIEVDNAKDCLRCHLSTTRLEDGRVSMQTPHPQLSNCLQCHVPGDKITQDFKNYQWKGLKEPKRGDRWSAMSPPTVPHRIYLRENCLSCHGPNNPNTALRTTHPERTSCLQCHVPNFNNEF